MKFKKINLEEHVSYEGRIVKYAIDENKYFFRIFVEIEGIEGISFLKCIRYAEYMPSVLSEFCEEFGILDNRGNVNFDELIEMQVIVSLNLGKDGNFYIADIEPIYEEDYGE